MHIYSSLPHPSSLSVVSLRVGLVSSIYPLVCASSLRHPTFPSPPPTFLCPCVDRAITSLRHRFPSLQPVAFACVLFVAWLTWACILLTNTHSFVSFIDRGSADTSDAQHTNKPAPLVSLLETYLSSVHFFSLLTFLVVAIPTNVFLQSCNTFDYYPLFSLLSSF